MSTPASLAGFGPNNSGFQAGGTEVLSPSTIGQANTAYDQAQDALAQQKYLAQALQGQGAQGMSSQSALTQALMSQMQGGGPNPALAQLNQATGQNVANQAALMASQRGASSNAGLIARQAAQQGAAAQQQAAGQGAVMQAQQQLAAQGQLQNLAASQVGQNLGATSAYNQAAQGEQANILNGIAAQNQARVGLQSNINNANAQMAQTNANNSSKAVSGAFSGAGAALGIPMAKGGMVPDHIKGMSEIYHPQFAYGGAVGASGDMGSEGSPQAAPNNAASGDKEEGDKKGAMMKMAPMLVGLPPVMASRGGAVLGKAKVKGDSLQNDTVNAKLSPGEVVIPRSVMQSKDPVKGAADFVAQELRKHGKSVGQEEGDFKEALKKAISSRKKK